MLGTSPERTGYRSLLESSESLAGSQPGSDVMSMHLRRPIIRHAFISLLFTLVYLLLNRPEVVFFSRIGFVAWYPAVGLAMALMLGISPWYALLACFSA